MLLRLVKGLAWLVRKVWFGLNGILNLSMMTAFALMTLTVTIGVILRYILGSGLLGLEEFALLIVAYAFYIGAALGIRDRQHVTVSLLNILPISAGSMKFIRLLTDFMTMVAGTLIAYYMVQHWLFVSAGPGIYVPFPFHERFVVAGVAIGWTLICIFSTVNFVKTVCRRGQH